MSGRRPDHESREKSVTAPAPGEPGAPAARDGSLIANFYGKQGRPEQLTDGLIRSLALAPRAPGSYADQDGKTLLHWFDLPAASARGITVVQVALNADGPVESAWRAMRQRLEAAVGDGGGLTEVLGYCLIYQAELVPGIVAGDACAALRPAARRLAPDSPGSAPPLASAAAPGGHLWLTSIPLQGDGVQAGTVYVALSEPGSTERLVREALYSRAAPLLMVDLIAHKGYFQIRQYRLGNLDEQYRARLGELSDRTDDVLGSLSQAAVHGAELGQLASEYRLLTRAVMRLDGLRLAVNGEVFNLDWWRQRPGGDDIAECHHSHLVSGGRELELLVAQGQRPLEAAKIAVDMVQARLDKQRGDQQQRIETILSAAATVLSVLVLVDRSAAGAILVLLGARPPVGIWPELAVQLACVAVFSVLVVLAVRLIARTRRSS
jgi:hypothetical protein